MSTWNYEQAFCRNRGLISDNEQQVLRNSRVAIAGLGGVGGVHLTTLARLGVGTFTIADPDVFDVANTNRQQGAKQGAFGQLKAEVMANEVRAILPDVRLKTLPVAVDESNVSEFLDQVDIYVDGIDFFNIAARRLIFQECRRRKIWAVTAAPLGFSTAWLSFSPDSMSFDEYFAIQDNMPELDKLIHFAIGLAPMATHIKYIDLNSVDFAQQSGPSLSLACQLASGVAAAEVIKILLKKSVKPAPVFFQFDAFRQKLVTGRLPWGNRGPLQRLKAFYLRKRFSSQYYKTT